MLRLREVQAVAMGYSKLTFSTAAELGPRRKALMAAKLCSHPAVVELHASAKPEETGTRGRLLGGTDPDSVADWLREADNPKYTRVRFALMAALEEGRASSLQVLFPGEGLMYVVTNAGERSVELLLAEALGQVLEEMPLEEEKKAEEGAETP